MNKIDLIVDNHPMHAVVSHEHSVVVLVAHEVQGIGAIRKNNQINPGYDVDETISSIVYSVYGNVEWEYVNV